MSDNVEPHSCRNDIVKVIVEPLVPATSDLYHDVCHMEAWQNQVELNLNGLRRSTDEQSKVEMHLVFVRLGLNLFSCSRRDCEVSAEVTGTALQHIRAS